MSTLPSSASMLQLWGDSPGCGGARCKACIHPQFEGLGPQDWLVRVTSCAASGVKSDFIGIYTCMMS